MKINCFESGERKLVPSVLVYLRRGEEFLMIHRGAQSSKLREARPLDHHQGKWNGLGGKCEADESPLEAAIREVHEESNLLLAPEQLRAIGVLQFPHFKAHKEEDWITFVFVGEVREEQVASLVLENPEGSLHWVPMQAILSLNLWEGDRHFIPWVIEGKSFLGTFWYQEKKLVRHWLTSFHEPSAQFSKI